MIRSIVLLSSLLWAQQDLCLQVLEGQDQVWALSDDDGNGIVNQAERSHPCYVTSMPLLGIVPHEVFGFVSLSPQRITFRTYQMDSVRIDVFNREGTLLRRIETASVQAGQNVVGWRGDLLDEGLYLFRLEQGLRSSLIRAVMVK